MSRYEINDLIASYIVEIKGRTSLLKYGLSHLSDLINRGSRRTYLAYYYVH